LAEKKKVRKVNREGQRWTDDRAGMTLRLPLELREAVTEEARVKGDLARIVLFALSHVDRKDVEIQQTRKAGLPLLFSSIAARGSRGSDRSPGVGRRGKRQRERYRRKRPRRVLQTGSRRVKPLGKNYVWRFGRGEDFYPAESGQTLYQ